MLATLRTLAIAATASIVAVATPAAAADVAHRTVSYADLDLRSDAGVARLDKRIRIALDDVCGSTNTRDLAARAQAAECRHVAMAAIRPNVALAVATARSDTQLALATPAIRVDAR